MLKKGMEVYWTKDPIYIGVVEEIYEFTDNVMVQFEKPKRFRVKVAMSAVAPTARQIAYENQMAIKNFSEEEKADLKAMYIDMALATMDVDWLKELVDGEIL